MTAKKYELTEAHKKKLKPWADKWIANALNTTPMTDEDRRIVTDAMNGMYEAAKLKPVHGYFVSSQMTGAIAASVASGVWWLRENPKEAIKLFGAAPTERELYDALRSAVAIAVANGMSWLRSEKAVVNMPATDAATGAATDAATGAATGAATDAATGAATDAATRAATDAATWAATDAATRAATRAATDAATRAATDAATWAATGAATDAATDAATRAATEAATGAATRAATGAATWAATWAATDAATGAATGAATDAATRAATGAATRAATDAATRAATDAATWAATGAATWAATGAATDAATDAATGAATWAATWAATRAATRAATDAATRSPVVLFLLACCGKWGNMADGGNHWSGYGLSFLSFFRHVAKLKLPEYDAYRHYEAAGTHGSWRFMHSKFWIVSDRPTAIGRDEQNRAHCATGPQIAWSDGWSSYSWHGVRIPGDWIEHKESIDPQLALTWPNIEQRRCLIEILGWKSVLGKLNQRVIDTDKDPEIGQLIEVDLPDVGKARFLKVLCGTKREFFLCVPETVQTALAANAWTWGLDGKEYAPEVRT